MEASSVRGREQIQPRRGAAGQPVVQIHLATKVLKRCLCLAESRSPSPWIGRAAGLKHLRWLDCAALSNHLFPPRARLLHAKEPRSGWQVGLIPRCPISDCLRSSSPGHRLPSTWRVSCASSLTALRRWRHLECDLQSPIQSPTLALTGGPEADQPSVHGHPRWCRYAELLKLAHDEGSKSIATELVLPAPRTRTPDIVKARVETRRGHLLEGLGVPTPERRRLPSPHTRIRVARPGPRPAPSVTP